VLQHTTNKTATTKISSYAPNFTFVKKPLRAQLIHPAEVLYPKRDTFKT